MMKTITTIKCPSCRKEIDISEDLVRVSTTIRGEVQKEFLLSLRGKEKIIDDLKVQLDNALRKVQQNSQQHQGEVMEQAIITILSGLYPHDIITQSKKGSNAADVLQEVKLQNGIACGKIYYESKNTKQWSDGWIDKFKQDNLKTRADVLVLVTNTLPKSVEKYAVIDDVWVCDFNNIRELSLVLRYGLIKLYAVLSIQNGKETKMQKLYSYLTSEEFKNTFEAIINGFKTIKESHESEKIRTLRLWKEREKTLEEVIASSVEFYATVRGVSGSETPEIKMLESSSID